MSVLGGPRRPGNFKGPNRAVIGRAGRPEFRKKMDWRERPWRGFTLAPLLAEQVAAVALGASRPLPRDLFRLVDPARYALAGRRKA